MTSINQMRGAKGRRTCFRRSVIDRQQCGAREEGGACSDGWRRGGMVDLVVCVFVDE